MLPQILKLKHDTNELIYTFEWESKIKNLKSDAVDLLFNMGVLAMLLNEN